MHHVNMPTHVATWTSKRQYDVNVHTAWKSGRFDSAGVDDVGAATDGGLKLMGVAIIIDYDYTMLSKMISTNTIIIGWHEAIISHINKMIGVMIALQTFRWY